MKLREKRRALSLRKQGVALGDIARRLSVSKASVSLWVRNVHLTDMQVEKLRNKPHSRIAIEKRRTARLTKENARRDAIRAKAFKSIRSLPSKTLLLMGLSLYWAEGTKKKRGVVEFTNSDPKMIRIMMKFFRDSCKVSEQKFRGHVFLHEHLSVKNAESYWSSISGIPLTQFHKTSVQHNKKRIKKDTLPCGTFAIIICDTELRLKIDGWTEGVCSRILGHVH